MRRALRYLAAGMLAAAALAGCSISWPTPRKFAILLGINTYPGNNLAYPVADAAAMAALLTANGFAPGDVILRTEAAATKAQLVSDIAALAALMGPEDLFVLYYSGHGTVYPVQGSDREWILPAGSIDASRTFVPDAAIYDSELGSILDALPTARRVVILDSCYSGGLIGDGLEVDTVPPALFDNTLFAGLVTPAAIIQAIRNYATFTTTDNGGVSPFHALTIAAAGAAEASYESGSAPYAGHGVMTHFLLQAASSGDLDGDGAVTVLEAFALAKAGIDTTWNVVWEGTKYVFSPHVSGGPIDLVLF